MKLCGSCLSQRQTLFWTGVTVKETVILLTRNRQKITFLLTLMFSCVSGSYLVLMPRLREWR